MCCGVPFSTYTPASNCAVLPPWPEPLPTLATFIVLAAPRLRRIPPLASRRTESRPPSALCALLITKIAVFCITRKPALKDSFLSKSLQVGRYLVSPLARRDSHGRYAASVSIRSGQSNTTHDRLMRFTPRFESADEALKFATGEALDYINSKSRGVSVQCFD